MLFAEVLETQNCFDEGVITLDGRREHRLHHGHRLPAVDRMAPHSSSWAAGWTCRFRGPCQELAAKVQRRFNPPPRCWPDLSGLRAGVTSRRNRLDFRPGVTLGVVIGRIVGPERHCRP